MKKYQKKSLWLTLAVVLFYFLGIPIILGTHRLFTESRYWVYSERKSKRDGKNIIAASDGSNFYECEISDELAGMIGSNGYITLKDEACRKIK